MPQLDSAWKKVILGASIATVTAFLATLAVQKKKKKDSKPIKEESVMMEEAVQKPKSPSWSELVEDEHQVSSFPSIFKGTQTPQVGHFEKHFI